MKPLSLFHILTVLLIGLAGCGPGESDDDNDGYTPHNYVLFESNDDRSTFSIHLHVDDVNDPDDTFRIPVYVYYSLKEDDGEHFVMGYGADRAGVITTDCSLINYDGAIDTYGCYTYYEDDTETEPKYKEITVQAGLYHIVTMTSRYTDQGYTYEVESNPYARFMSY